MSRPLQLHFDTHGSGSPVMILHGLFGSSRNWQSVARGLAAQHRVYTVDLRNHGRSPHTDSMDYLELAADVRALIINLDLHELALVGHSMGGKAAMTMALYDPDRLSRLVVVDIAPVAYPDDHSGLIDTMISLPLDRVRRRADADRLLGTGIPDDSLRLFLLQNLVIDGSGARWRINLKALRSEMPNLIGPLPNLGNKHYAGPTTFIRGGRSERVLPAHEAVISRSFSNYDILTIPHAGHWPHTETRDEFLVHLNRILAEPRNTRAI